MRTPLWAVLTVLVAPFALVIALLRRQKNVRKVLVIQHAKLGDMVCTTHMFRAIKQTYPHAEVHVLCWRRAAEVLEANPFVDRCHFLETPSRWRLLTNLRRERFDWVINVLPGSFGSMVGVWTCAPHRVATTSRRHGILVRLLSLLSQYRFTYERGTRTFDHYLRLLTPLGVEPVPYRYDYFIHPEELTQIDRWLLERGIRPGERFAVLSLRPGNRVKEWPLPHFIELASRMGRSWELTIVFSAVEPELTQEACAAVLPPTKAVAASGLSLRETAALIARASLFIGVDTGPLYIAHALSVPVVAIVGPSCPVEQLPPEGPCVALVPPPPGCTPWLFIAASPRQATTEMLRCIRETTPEIVFPAVQRLLGAPTRAS